MIELRDITKFYPTPAGTHTVLDSITVAIEGRENLGILGRNGAGKSTLLRIIGGAELPDRGEVIRHGRVSWPLGFAGGFNSSLSGEENCRFVARIYGADIDAVVEETEAFAEIGRHFRLPVKTYSSGMRARLAFGLSMAIDFEIYLVDEVTAVGDKRFQDKCRDAFLAREERASVIIVSHQMATIAQYCQRCAVLERGRLTIFDSVEEAQSVYEVLAS